MSAFPARESRVTAMREDLAKIPAFFRRDLFVLLSYRGALVAGWVNLIVQVLIFAFLDRMIPSTTLPEYGGREVGYLAFVTTALIMTSVMQLTMGRLVSSVQNEQMMGTLEALLVTPTAPTTLQLGSIAYDLLYVPLRTAIFLLLMGTVLRVDLHWNGLGPTAGLLFVFIPFAWGLGVLASAGVLTFRRGPNAAAVLITLLTLGAGAYFPVTLLPGWIQGLMRFNPITLAIEGSRDALLAEAGWADLGATFASLAVGGVIMLAIGVAGFRLSLRRELRRGTVGLY